MDMFVFPEEMTQAEKDQFIKNFKKTEEERKELIDKTNNQGNFKQK